MINEPTNSSAAPTEAPYPASLIVHTPSGPVPACEAHAAKIKVLLSFMGCHTNATPAPEGAECPNCRNAAKAANQSHLTPALSPSGEGVESE